ncbi:hypothetical protein IU404_00206 [Limosilactobacillus reuteri]|nr:hypothetical protein IU404_00206 [Limosilactobacillus reuteri]UFK68829.1 hypothetical protein IVR12_01928 [Limosilactobacillus reuteri]
MNKLLKNAFSYLRNCNDLNNALYNVKIKKIGES